MYDNILDFYSDQLNRGASLNEIENTDFKFYMQLLYRQQQGSDPQKEPVKRGYIDQIPGF
jgi:hypothetical protein